MTLKNLGDVSYFRLNNEINRPVDGKIPLHKDRAAPLRAFFLKISNQTPRYLTALLIKSTI